VTVRPVIATHRADEDIEHAVQYYVDNGAEETAARLVNALEAAIHVIAQHPSIGSSRFAVETEIAELRSFALTRLPYVILYTDDADAVRVHRVLHTSRDIPGEF
jgi:toxin ParE1/3/4